MTYCISTLQYHLFLYLCSLLLCRERTMSEVVKYFPRLPSTNAWGNEVLEYTNKYWVMLNEIKITEVYTSKNARK